VVVELLERELSSRDPEIPKVKAKDQAPRDSIKRRTAEVRKCLVSLFSTKCVSFRDLAARLDTIHRLAPAFCACLHQATLSSGGSPRHREEWEEFFLEPDRLAADDATNADRDAKWIEDAARQYQEDFSLERAFRVERATASSGVIEAVLYWPSDFPSEARRRQKAEYARAVFFAVFRELPLTMQEGVLPFLREAIIEELIPEGDFTEPWNYHDSERDRWFFRVRRFGDEHLAFLFGEQKAKEVIELAKRATEEFWRLNEHPRVSSSLLREPPENTLEATAQGLNYLLKGDSPLKERMTAIEERLNFLLGHNDDQFDRDERRQSHLLNLVLNALENDSVYPFDSFSYPLLSQYCELLWGKAVSAILLEQKITIVESAHDQWQWLELMRKLSIVRLRAQHPEWRLGWRW
jgi:hypothetical protein